LGSIPSTRWKTPSRLSEPTFRIAGHPSIGKTVLHTNRCRKRASRTICYEILREAKQFNPREFRILASQEVVDMFLEEESQHLAMLGDFIGKKISLQVETAYHQEQYDVILM
jgi:Ribonuclease G/E